MNHFAAHTAPSNPLLIPTMLQKRKKGRESEHRKVAAAGMKFSPVGHLGPICLSCKKPPDLLPVWRCHGVKTCTRKGQLQQHLYTTNFPVHCNLWHKTRKTAWNSCLPESYLLNASCLAGNWNNRWIKGSRKITLSGAENRSWEASTRNSPKIDIISVKRKMWGFCWGEKERGWGKKSQTRTLGYSEKSLKNFNSKYVLHQLSWIICLNVLDTMVKLNYWFAKIL